MTASPDPEAQIRQLYSFNAEMLERAGAGDWERVIEREEQCRALLDQLFQSPLPTPWLPLLKDAAQATLDNNAQVQALARMEMDRISDELRVLRQGRRALSAYSDP